MRPTKLSDIEIQRELGTVTGWTRRGDTITRTFSFATFPAGIAWIGRVAEVAERMQHHPDLDIRYTKVAATLSTHDADGITSFDFDLAREMEKLAP